MIRRVKQSGKINLSCLPSPLIIIILRLGRISAFFFNLFPSVTSQLYFLVFNPKLSLLENRVIFFCLNKYQIVTHVSTFIFQGLFKNITFWYEALVTTKLWAIFYTDRNFYHTVTSYPMH